MDNQPAKQSIPRELQTLMDAEFEFAGFKSVDPRLAALQATLSGRRGVVSVEFVGEKLAVRYNPEEITAADLRDLIRQAGFELAAADSGPSTPPLEPSESGQRTENPAK